MLRHHQYARADLQHDEDGETRQAYRELQCWLSPNATGRDDVLVSLEWKIQTGRGSTLSEGAYTRPVEGRVHATPHRLWVLSDDAA
jgi:hypothetical protein